LGNKRTGLTVCWKSENVFDGLLEIRTWGKWLLGKADISITSYYYLIIMIAHFRKTRKGQKLVNHFTISS
jgi:hypothetical protein